MIGHQSRVLLTGATGLLGGEILRALAELPVRRIWALARGRASRDPAERLCRRLARSGGDPAAPLPEPVRAVEGNLVDRRLGLDPAVAAELAREVDVVVHCAAETSFIRDQQVRSTNVEGTRHLVEFARRCRRPPAIVYLSSAASAGARRDCVVDEADRPTDDRHFNEYTRSKRVAEAVLAGSGLPVLVLRPSIVIGVGLPDAAFARQILWFAPLVTAFDALPVDPRARVDAVPVSYFVEAALALLRLPRRRFGCYHISSGHRHSLSCDALFDILSRHYGRRRPLRLVPPGRWTAADERRATRSPLCRRLFACLRHYLPFLNMNVVYDDTRLRLDTGLRPPGVDAWWRRPATEFLNLITLEDGIAEASNP